MKERRHNDVLLHETIVRLDAHETADSLMFKQISEQLMGLKVDVRRVFNHFWTAAIGIIGILLAVSAYLYVESAKVNKEFMAQMINSVKQNPHNGQ